MFDNTFINRVLHKTLYLLLLPACMLWSAISAISAMNETSAPAVPGRPQATTTAAGARPEFPAHWEGRPVRPLALSDVEERFARRFPGTITRLAVAPDQTDSQVLVLRTVERPTRMLHPAADCYQGLGYRISAQRLEFDAEQRLWRCFEAARAGHRQRVCERIVDAKGNGFTDTSAWYWAAALGQSHGPWQALTLASPL